MKPIAGFGMVLIGVLLAGCVVAPHEAKQQMRVAEHRFGSIERGMSRQEVVAVLGTAQWQDAAGHFWWTGRYGAGNNEAIEVGFDAAARVDFAQVHETRRRSFFGRTYITRESTVMVAAANPQPQLTPPRQPPIYDETFGINTGSNDAAVPTFPPHGPALRD